MEDRGELLEIDSSDDNSIVLGLGEISGAGAEIEARYRASVQGSDRGLRGYSGIELRERGEDKRLDTNSYRFSRPGVLDQQEARIKFLDNYLDELILIPAEEARG